MIQDRYSILPKSHWYRLYELFPDQAGTQLLVRAIRIMRPELTDEMIRHVLDMPEESFVRWIRMPSDRLGGDPDERLLRRVARLAGLLGSKAAVDGMANMLKAVTMAANQDFYGVQAFVESYPVAVALAGGDPADMAARGGFRTMSGRVVDVLSYELCARIGDDPAAARRWIRELPAMMPDAGGPERLCHVLDVLAYMAARDEFDGLIMGVVHARLDAYDEPTPMQDEFLRMFGMERIRDGDAPAPPPPIPPRDAPAAGPATAPAPTGSPFAPLHPMG